MYNISMTNQTLFSFQSIENDLTTAIRSCLINFENSEGDSHDWVQTELKHQIETKFKHLG